MSTSNQDRWPERVDLSIPNQNVRTYDPADEEFDYAEAFEKLDLD